MANGLAFVIDKILLNQAFKRSATYAGLVGLLSILAITLSPWVNIWPRGITLLWVIISGVAFTTALWMFFSALSRGEASRVVPIISALIPMVTLLGTTIFLHERLALKEYIGFFLLIIATILLSSGKATQRLKKSAIIYSIISAILFAVMSVTIKTIYDDVGFLSGFVSTRVIAALTGLILITIIDPLAGKEIKNIFAPKKSAGKQKGMNPKTAAILAIVGQSLGGLGFVGVQLAISMGSAAIVNSLQVIQFALLVVIAFIMKSKAKTLLGESLEKSVIVVKSIALVLMALGLAFIVK
ncbi:EamA family transporter [Patescibacteria group bacterium]|nr:EamA family transporter [Patescibacteria group bacterium]